MEVILREDFPALGYVGDRVNVRPGYARNYLLPRGIAMEVSGRNSALMNHLISGVTAKRRKLKRLAEDQAAEIGQVVLEFALKVGKRGKSFGSITARDVERQLEEKGYSFDRKRIRLGEPIKRAGEFKVELRLHSEVTVPVKVLVTAEAVKDKEEHEEEDDVEVPPTSDNGAGAVADAEESSSTEEEVH